MGAAIGQTAALPPGTDHSTQGRYSSSAGARGAAANVAGGGRASSQSDKCSRMARTTHWSSMNATMRIAPPQSGQISGSAANTFLIYRAQLARMLLAVGVSSDRGAGPSGIFSRPWRRRRPRCTLE